MLVRYIRPRVIDVATVNINVPVRRDGFERIVVIAKNQDVLVNELPEEPEENAGYRCIALNDPEGEEPQDDPEEIPFEDLTEEDLENIKKTDEEIEKTAPKDKRNQLEELKNKKLDGAAFDKEEAKKK